MFAIPGDIPAWTVVTKDDWPAFSWTVGFTETIEGSEDVSWMKMFEAAMAGLPVASTSETETAWYLPPLAGMSPDAGATTIAAGIGP
jgi:hypothetical protein